LLLSSPNEVGGQLGATGGTATVVNMDALVTVIA
jgi:hypothetical protein